MGFWDEAVKIAKNVGTVVSNELEQSANETREIKKKYGELSDNELIDIVNGDGFFGKSPKERTIAYGILKTRGFTAEDIKARKS